MRQEARRRSGKRATNSATCCRLVLLRTGRPHSEAGLSQAEGDAGFAQIVRRHFHADAVADGEADEVFAHLARDVRENFVLLHVQSHAEHGSGQNRFDRAFNFD